MITDGENGFIAEDAPAISRIIQRLAGDPALRRLVGLKARDRSLEMFAMERLHREVLEVYSRAIAPAEPRADG
jgi:glycosyltransferase involved in cell wall biosynthesis